MDYKFWDKGMVYRVKCDIIANIKDILSAVINEGEFYTLKNAIDMAHVDGGIIADDVREVGLIDDDYGISVRIDKPLTGNLIEETIDGYCVDSLLDLRNELLTEIVSPIYEKIGNIGSVSLTEDFIVTINDPDYGDSFKAVVKHINTSDIVCSGGGMEIWVLPLDKSISLDELRFADTSIASIKEFKELADFAVKCKNKKYKWFAECNDGAFEDESRKLFDTKQECYNDMRNAALEKMKWNTEFDEDFDHVDDGDYIGYHVRFSKDKIIHESYSGIYTYEIKQVYEK